MIERSSETLELSMLAEYKKAREVSKAVTEASPPHKGCFLSPLMFASFALTLNTLDCTDFAEVRLHSQTQRRKNILCFPL